MKTRRVVSVALVMGGVLAAGSASAATRTDKANPGRDGTQTKAARAGKAAKPKRSTEKPVGLRVGVPSQPILAPDVRVVAVDAFVQEPEATYVSLASAEALGIHVSEEPKVGRRAFGRGVGVMADSYSPPVVEEGVERAPTFDPGVLITSFNAGDFDTNPTVNSGFLFIPPDSHAAAGPTQVANVVNCFIQWWNKDGSSPATSSLAAFFAGVLPLTATFDPKVIYDQYAGRFVVVTLEQTDTATGAPANTSRIFVAVSDDSNPAGTWYATQINSKINIGGVDRWMDYPGFAVDEEAVYVTGNMFGFGASGTFGGARLWVINKGLSGGFYSGGPASVSVLDPYAGVGSVATTTQPAHVFGTAPAGQGTYLVSYSGLTDNTNEYVQHVRIDNPLGSPTFTQGFVNLGDFEDNPMTDLADAAQSGSARAIEVNDRRALNAVWRQNSIWISFTMKPKATGPEAGQTTAAWLRLDSSSGAPALADQGRVGGETIAGTTHTFFPSIAVNRYREAAVGFSASAASIFAGSYFTWRAVGDPAGSTRSPALLRAGTDFYVRTFSTNPAARNRWGDYSGIAVDPVDQCFWVFNQHAMARGTPTGSEDGRWATAYGKFCGDVVFADGFQNE